MPKPTDGTFRTAGTTKSKYDPVRALLKAATTRASVKPSSSTIPGTRDPRKTVTLPYIKG